MLATFRDSLANTTPAQIRLFVQASRASWFPPPRGDVQSANLDENAVRLWPKCHLGAVSVQAP